MNASREGRRPLILMAEDDEDDRLLMAEALNRTGMGGDVRFFEDGVELMEHLIAVVDSGDPSTLESEIILLDINMPRKDGWDVLAELKEDCRLSAIPVILLSTSSNQFDVERGYRMGASSYITKPNSFNELVILMSELKDYWFKTVRLPDHVSS